MTYSRLFEKQKFSQDKLQTFRESNLQTMTDDKLRCQSCQGFYWRVWIDQAQCVSCQQYTMIEIGDRSASGQLEFDFVRQDAVDAYDGTLLNVPWVREQLRSAEGFDVRRRIKDPLSGRSEFVVYRDRFRCRVTGYEIAVVPNIQKYWLLKALPRKKPNRFITTEEALNLVKNNRPEQPTVPDPISA